MAVSFESSDGMVDAEIRNTEDRSRKKRIGKSVNIDFSDTLFGTMGNISFF